MHLPKAIRFRKQRRQISRFKELQMQTLRSPDFVLTGGPDLVEAVRRAKVEALAYELRHQAKSKARLQEIFGPGVDDAAEQAARRDARAAASRAHQAYLDEWRRWHGDNPPPFGPGE